MGVSELKLSSTVKAICCTYREIIREDGAVEHDELIEMLKVDNAIPDKFKNVKGLEAIAEYIKTGISTRELMNYRRIKLYKQGLTPQEMALKEKVDVCTIRYWHKTRKLPYNEKKPAATGK